MKYRVEEVETMAKVRGRCRECGEWWQAGVTVCPKCKGSVAQVAPVTLGEWGTLVLIIVVLAAAIGLFFIHPLLTLLALIFGAIVWHGLRTSN